MICAALGGREEVRFQPRMLIASPRLEVIPSVLSAFLSAFLVGINGPRGVVVVRISLEGRERSVEGFGRTGRGKEVTGWVERGRVAKREVRREVGGWEGRVDGRIEVG